MTDHLFPSAVSSLLQSNHDIDLSVESLTDLSDTDLDIGSFISLDQPDRYQNNNNNNLGRNRTTIRGRPKRNRQIVSGTQSLLTSQSVRSSHRRYTVNDQIDPPIDLNQKSIDIVSAPHPTKGIVPSPINTVFTLRATRRQNLLQNQSSDSRSNNNHDLFSSNLRKSKTIKQDLEELRRSVNPWDLILPLDLSDIAHDLNEIKLQKNNNLVSSPSSLNTQFNTPPPSVVTKYTSTNYTSIVSDTTNNSSTSSSSHSYPVKRRSNKH